MSPSATPPPILPAVRPALRAVAEAVVPEAAWLDAAAWADLEAIVEDTLADRPPRIRRRLALFLRVLDAAPVLRWGRRLRALDAARRDAFLRSIERSPIPLLRRGLWGVRTLVFMGYYARPAAAEEIGYGARPAGWQARG